MLHYLLLAFPMFSRARVICLLQDLFDRFLLFYGHSQVTHEVAAGGLQSGLPSTHEGGRYWARMRWCHY